MIALDLETAPRPGCPATYALQPWRYNEGTARLLCMAIARDSGEARVILGDPSALREALESLAGREVALFHGVFDLAWLHAYGLHEQVKKITWVDARIYWRYASNNQVTAERPGWSLAAAVHEFFATEPIAARFAEMKATPVALGENPAYWLKRAKLDAVLTARVALAARARLSVPERRCAEITMRCLSAVARSWWRGVRVDVDAAARMVVPTQDEMLGIETSLGVATAPARAWMPSKVLASPRRLGELLYGAWGLPCERRTDKGAPSADKIALTYLSHRDDRVRRILRWRKLNTERSKFILGIPESVDYLGSAVTHSTPTLFSTYTGRMTYASRLGAGGENAKAKIGLPLHQWPRGERMRNLIVAPEGKLLLEADAAGQELRLIAHQANEATMLQILGAPPPYDDMHSFTASRIAHCSFNAALDAKKRKAPEWVGGRGYRDCAKLVNLSKQYRTSVARIRTMALVEYGIHATEEEVAKWCEAYEESYPGIRRYWGEAIYLAKLSGHARTLGGRRFGLDRWTREFTWGTESSAINFPVQGSGADMKELAIATLSEKFPEAEFSMDLHDGLFFLVDDSPLASELAEEIKYTLDTLNYREAWEWDPRIPMPWDVGVGPSWGRIKK